MVRRRENRNPEDPERLKALADQHCDLATTVELAKEFLQLLRQRQGDPFDDWLTKVLKSPLKPFQAFAEGLFEGYDAVKASMMLKVSNGAVEGFDNRLKLLKRQMYGRAGLEVLQRRFLLANQAAY